MKKGFFTLSLILVASAAMANNSIDKKIQKETTITKTTAKSEGGSRRSECRHYAAWIADELGLDRHGRRAEFHNCMSDS